MQLIGADYFVSAIGPAFEVFARYSRVVRLSGEEVGVDELMVLARQAVARHAIRRLLGGENLAALDGRSLLYLTWRWAYDGDAIPADEAYKLGRAFDIRPHRPGATRRSHRQDRRQLPAAGSPRAQGPEAVDDPVARSTSCTSRPVP